MKASAHSYLPPRSMREDPPAPPSEMEAQALWFEQLYQRDLQTDDGRTVEIIQPGFWNHTGGPDFSRAVVRFRKHDVPDADLTIGNVEVHLAATDWRRFFMWCGMYPRAKPSSPPRPIFAACRKLCSARSSSRRGPSCARSAPPCCNVPCPARYRGAARQNSPGCLRSKSRTSCARRESFASAKKRSAGIGASGSPVPHRWRGEINPFLIALKLGFFAFTF